MFYTNQNIIKDNFSIEKYREDNNIIYNNNNSNILFLDESGKVGINKRNPLYQLDIDGNANISGNFDINGNTSIMGNMEVMGNINLSGNINFKGNSVVNGNINCENTIIYKDLNVSNTFNIKKSLIIPKGKQSSRPILSSDQDLGNIRYNTDKNNTSHR